MNKKILITIIILSILLIGGYFMKNFLTNLFKQNYVVFPANYDISFLFGNNKRYTPTNTDIQKAIELLESFLKSKKEIQALLNYKVQFFGYLNEKEEKIIWANFFCSDYKNWKKDLVSVEDGGNCYFNIKINLNTQKVFDFNINGET
ncbi:hypothetical protein CVV26_02910 [Candidatus Kuenenbacteria bacterium HGW-Kuenenbacteria-1]|uniref:Uncharacterized protein n=1 Tax=Candidatus Kuenenbacteria bacterium HGW-Kuenenbacteria-1 TaxID=2013812 RepID=A0A2N1UMW4_9BACT|nr:MAG: hypothetical protein CVV26_02910 [Candidatus Kuenenbacteria bacterium HGW-Kuenenbacteria-1]